MSKQLTYSKLTTELRYRNLSEAELCHIIGNKLTPGAYDKIPGKFSHDKAKWLKAYFEALECNILID